MSRGTKVEHPDGMTFKSELEHRVYCAARAKRKKLVYEPTYIPYHMKGNYLPDFILPNGVIIEVKGYLDAASCKKMRAVKLSNPELDIRFVFSDANKKMHRSSKMKYWQWSERYGFPWAEGIIPIAWWKE